MNVSLRPVFSLLMYRINPDVAFIILPGQFQMQFIQLIRCIKTHCYITDLSTVPLLISKGF
ncbi:hypothetical protein CS542_05390 [Pedobacter sp. IW39]|nr:hypothetical protein CS542_05390 [Pedobacter sp. IW39]